MNEVADECFIEVDGRDREKQAITRQFCGTPLLLATAVLSCPLQRA